MGEEKNTKILEIQDVIITYGSAGSETIAADNINIDIYDNEITVILGPSGCGKTSLLNTMGCLLTPKSGKIIWNKQDITKFNLFEKNRFRREVVSYVFQRYNLIDDLTVYENLQIASVLNKNTKEIDKVLAMVKIADKARKYPRQISGGEQQRVCIARALLKKPQIFLCDEPTGALDSKNADNIIEILQDLCKNENIPIVMITHNEEYTKIADHIIKMKDGKIVKDSKSIN